MSAVAAIVLGLLKAGDHIVAGNQLYGRTMRLVSQELPRGRARPRRSAGYGFGILNVALIMALPLSA